jgi:CRISPR-associated protein Csx17
VTGTGRCTLKRNGSSARDRSRTLPLRALLSPVTLAGFPGWTHRPALAPLSTGLAAALAEAARRRGFPGAVEEVVPDLEPAVQGVRIGFQRGALVATSAVSAFVAGELDEHRLADLLAGLLTIDWSGSPDLVFPHPERAADPGLDLLLPFTGTARIRLPDKAALLRPSSTGPMLLQAGRSAEVLADAARRLRIAGLRQVIIPGAARYEGTRLAAVLLMRVPDDERLAALRRVAVLPQLTSDA